MGTDKTLLEIDGKPLIVRQVELLQTVFENLLVVTNSEAVRAIVPHVPSVEDSVKDQGPIGGIHAALHAATTEWIFVVGCDMPFVNRELARHLFELREGYDIVAPLSEERIETLHTCYSTRCLPAIERQIEKGARKLLRFFDELAALKVPVEVCRQFDPSLRMFMNINTPEEYEALRSTAG